VLAVLRLCELYPGICLTTEEKARKNLSQGSRRVPAGTIKTIYTAIQEFHQDDWEEHNVVSVLSLAPNHEQVRGT